MSEWTVQAFGLNSAHASPRRMTQKELCPLSTWEVGGNSDYGEIDSHEDHEHHLVARLVVQYKDCGSKHSLDIWHSTKNLTKRILALCILYIV